MAASEDYNRLNATDEDVLIPFLYIGASKEKSSGRMVNNTSTNATLKSGESFIIPKGYHDGTGIVKVLTLEDQTNDANVTPNKMLSRKTAWSRGVLVTGIIDSITAPYDIEAIRFEGGILRCFINQGAYLSGSNNAHASFSEVKSALKLGAEMIPVGQTILGTTGTFDAAGTVNPEDVLLGKTIYSQGKKIVGTLQLNSLY